MEEKYGKKYGTLKLSGMIHLPFVMLSILFAVVFVACLVTTLKGGRNLMGVAIAAGIIFVVVLALLLRQIFSLRLDIYEDTLVQQNLFNQRVIRADELRAIIWQFPGVNPMNPRAARVNNTSAEFIFKDGSKTVKIQDSYYQEMEKGIAAFQTRNNIPKDLEVQKKGGQRYNDI